MIHLFTVGAEGFKRKVKIASLVQISVKPAFSMR